MSAADSDFNFDFNVSFTEEQQRAGDIEYNYARNAHAMDQIVEVHPVVAAIAKGVGTDAASYGARSARHERIRARRMARSTTRTPPTRAASTRSGTCTSGWIARRWAETRTASGGNATMSTARQAAWA